MRGEWTSVTLSDVSNDVSYGYTESATSENVGPKFLRITDIQGGIVNWESVPYCKISEDNHEKYKLVKGDIVVARTGNSTGENYLFYKGTDAVFASYLIRFRLETNRVDPRFIWYNLRTPLWWSFINSSKTGSAQAGANAKVLGRFPLRLPPLHEQQAIACILGAIDDKIELNRQMNRTLEEMARAIFKSWFVDFDPVRAKAAVGRKHPNWTNSQVSREACPNLKPEIAALFPDSFEDSELGEIPKGWRVIPLYETASFINGAAFKNDDFCQSGDGLPVIKIAELKEGISSQTKCSLRKANFEQTIDTGDLLYSWSGSPDTSLDAFLWTNGNGLLNQHIFKVVTPSVAQKRFVYYLLKQLRSTLIETARNKQTTGLGHVTVADMKRLKVCCPLNIVSDKFDFQIGAMFDRAFECLMQSRTLSALRDTLLPKLISGELRVPDAERIAGRCL